MQTLAQMERMALILATVAALVALAMWGADMALGVLAGGVVGALNFRALRLLGSRLIFRAESPSAQGLVAMATGLKFLLLLVLVSCLVVWVKIDPIAFAVGISAMVVAIPVGALWSVRAEEANKRG